MSRLALVSVVVVAASVWMCGASATTTLQGRVLTQSTGAPLSGVNVTQYSGCSNAGCSYSSADTDADGRFTLTVEPGQVQLTLEAADYTSDYLPTFDSFTVDDGQTVAVVYYLERGGSVSGTVRRADNGLVLQGVFVYFSDAQGSVGTQTDQNGYFELHQVRASSYIANAQASMGMNLQQQFYSDRAIVPPSQGLQLADSVTVASGLRTASVDFNLVVGATLDATVRDRYDGTLLRNTNLYLQFFDAQTALDPSFWYSQNVTTDSNGIFSLTGLPPHAVVLQMQGTDSLFTSYVYDCGDSCTVSSGKVVPLTAGASTAIAFSLQPGAVVAGHVSVKQSGTPVPGARVSVFQSSGNGPEYVVGSATTDSAGNYAVEHLSANNHPAVFAKVSDARLGDAVFVNQIYGGFDCAESTCIPSGAEPYVPIVDDGVSPNINFQLNEGGEILGDSVAYAGYSGILDVYMELFHANGTFDSGFFTGHDGSFASSGLASDVYYLVSHPVVASELPCMIYVLVPCGPAPQTVGTPITVTGTAHVDITVPLYTESIFSDGFE